MSQIQLPQPRKNWIKRQRALDALYAALDSRLILVVAGAGYGKTGILAQFAKMEGFAFSWLTLDDSEQDLRVFGEALVASLKHCFPGFGHQTMQLLTSSISIEQNIALLVRTLVRELSSQLTQPICMIVDDFHVVEASTPVIKFVDRLVAELPDEAHLVIASRNLPPLQLAMLIAEQQVAALGQSTLRLDQEETRQLIASLNNMAPAEIDPEAVSRAHAATEGWLVGLLMTTHIGNLRDAHIGLGAPRAVDLLGEYLLIGVMQQIPEELREFLLRSSALDEISIPFCENELKWPDTRQWIQEVERRNLFIQPIGATGDNGSGASETTYRYHPLFREFLVQRLRTDDPIMFAQLQRAIGAAHERNDNIELAVRHFITGGWGDDVMRLTETHATAFLQRGRYRTILDWLARLDAIAPGARRERHVLWQFEIWAHLNLGQDVEAMEALDRLDELYLRIGDIGRRDGLNIRRGLLLWRASDFEKALACAELVLHSNYPQPLWAQVEANRIASLCLYELGRLRDALDSITRAEHLTQSMGRAGFEALARVKLTRSMILDGLGETAASLRAAAEALALAEDIRDDGLLAESLVQMAELLLFNGRSDGLVEMARKGLELADATGNQVVRISGLSVLALILNAQGKLQDALQSGSAALSLARQITASSERGALLFSSLVGQAQALCRYALQERDKEQRTDRLQQALGLAREATAIAEASRSARLRLYAYTRLGAVQVAQGDFDLATSALNYAEVTRGQFNDNATGSVYLWQMMAAWDQPQPSFAQVASLLERVKQISNLRQQTYFIQAEGETAWQTYENLSSASDLKAMSAARHEPGATDQQPRPERPAEQTPQIALLQHDLRVCGFGPGRVWRGEELIATSQWGWSIPRGLFFYILTVRKATRAQMETAFWGESETAGSPGGFHNAKFAIKKAIGNPPMEFVNGQYRVNSKLDILYDVSCFEQLIASAKQSPPAEALNQLLEAANLYEDEFLLDFDTQWVLQTRYALAAKFSQCCMDAATAALSLNQPDAMIPLLERASQADDINEDIARMLMKVQWQAGKRRSALDAYNRLKAALQRELGLNPNRATEQLLSTIKGN